MLEAKVNPFRVIEEYKKIYNSDKTFDVYSHISEVLEVNRDYVKEVLLCYLYNMGMAKGLNNKEFIALIKKNFT